MTTLVQCPHCATNNEVACSGINVCFNCGEEFTVQETSEPQGKLEHHSGLQVLVVLIVIAGLAGILLVPVGLLFTAVLWIVAALMNRRVWTCSECASSVRKSARVCPACRCRLN